MECINEQCAREGRSPGALCRACYKEALKVGRNATCRTSECGRHVVIINRQLCERCYQRHRVRLRPGCYIEGCEIEAKTAGLCLGHYHRLQRYGDPLAGPGRGTPGKRRKLRRMEGRYVTANGYVKVRDDNAVGFGLWVLEHRRIMEQMLGRSLLKGENIHHKNGDRTDNRPDNLELWVARQPHGQRIEDLVAWAREILKRYGDMT